MNILHIFAISTVLLTSSDANAKRAVPSDVPDIITDDFVYTVPHWSSENGTNQNGGYIDVLDVKTGESAWGIQIYKTLYQTSREKDVQDVFITEIKLDKTRTFLEIKDEIDRRFELNLKNKKVTKSD